MTEQHGTTKPADPGSAPSERDAQRALDGASSEPRTLAPKEAHDDAARMDERANDESSADPSTPA
jgi:hypothetical protein